MRTEPSGTHCARAMAVLPIGLQRDIMIISVITWLVCGCASPWSPHGAVRAEEAVRDQQPAPTTLDAQDVIALQSESDDGGRYDWGPSVMKDGALYKMWWVRLGGAGVRQFTHSATGASSEVTYPDYGDRIYYAESRDGRAWHADGADYTGGKEGYGPDSDGPLMVLGSAETPDEYYHVGTPSVIKVDSTYYMYYEAPGGYAIRYLSGSDGAVTGQEYHNQVFVAVSRDGKSWRKHPSDDAPKPIVSAPEWNHEEGKRFYGLGQPSVYYRDGVYVEPVPV